MYFEFTINFYGTNFDILIYHQLPVYSMRLVELYPKIQEVIKLMLNHDFDLQYHHLRDTLRSKETVHPEDLVYHKSVLLVRPGGTPTEGVIYAQ